MKKEEIINKLQDAYDSICITSLRCTGNVDNFTRKNICDIEYHIRKAIIAIKSDNETYAVELAAAFDLVFILVIHCSLPESSIKHAADCRSILFELYLVELYANGRSNGYLN